MTGWKEEEGYPAGGGKIVVGGAGIVAVELAGNLSEALIAQGKRGILTLLVGSHGLLPTYPTRVQATAEEVLKSKGVHVIKDRSASHKGLTLGTKEARTFTMTLSSGSTLENVAAYLPAFVSGFNTDWLASAVSMDASGQVPVDAHLRAANHPNIFAIGGCAKLIKPERYLDIEKMTAQAKTVAANLGALAAGAPLMEHAEGGSTGENAAAALVQIGSWAAIVPETLPLPANFCLRACGPPLNVLFCCPCVAALTLCGGCPDCVFCCGLPCGGYPQGKATAHFLTKMYASGMYAKSTLGWAGLGASKPLPRGGGAPATEAMLR